ncbi:MULTISPECIES: ribosomal protein S18-alanine N-acetyltransferase [unclassified Enterococcus]|jgi:ribosomal-protein-alanine N-acetyltransferase|uniref:ribosomal protein S18-alanine N-acetyltransferase n=1 Tax=unclassified Enterococcus TaxID=2608891 RepID=UPI003D2A2F01
MLRRFKDLTKSFFKERSVFRQKTLKRGDRVYLLRQLDTSDIKELLALERAVYFGELPWTKSAFLSELRSPFTNLYLGIEENGKLIGFSGARVLGTDCHVTNIAVLPSHQRLGLGSVLIDEIENFAIMNRCETLSLEVRVSNKDAQRLYRKLGFQSRTIKKGYYTEKNEDAVDMIKRIKDA